MDKRGRIEVDDQFRTNIKSILAIGDVIPGPMLAHKVCVKSSCSLGSRCCFGCFQCPSQAESLLDVVQISGPAVIVPRAV